MPLSLSSLKKALVSLQNSINVINDSTWIDSLTKEQLDSVKAGVIQNFEFTYELCWKFMKRWLDVNYGKTYVEGVARRELFRRAAENLLIEDVDKWMDYHEARNKTSHIYNQNVAQEVLTVANVFINDARLLLENIEKKND
ncbi:MAG: nucleotidyltransferase substrate binding protein [Pseudomonadota bacterium]